MTPKSILIILTGALGDVARGFCVLKPLKNLFPETKIYWLIEAKWKQLVEIHPLIDEVITFNRKKGVKGIFEVKETFKNNNLKFDLTLDLQRNFKSGVFSILSSSEKRIGFNSKNTKEFNWFFNNYKIQEFSEKESKVLHYLKFIDKVKEIYAKDSESCYDLENLDFGIKTIDLDSYLPKDYENINFEQTRYKNIGVLLGSSWETKNWKDNNYLELIEKLLSNSTYKVFLLGDSSKIIFSEEIQKHFNNTGNLINYVGKTSLTELIAIINKLDAFVGPDSGPAHLASLVDTKYIGLFGPTNPNRVAPWGLENKIISSNIGCAQCDRKVCPDLNALCMKRIDAVLVYRQIIGLLSFPAH